MLQIRTPSEVVSNAYPSKHPLRQMAIEKFVPINFEQHGWWMSWSSIGDGVGKCPVVKRRVSEGKWWSDGVSESQVVK
jgi:hypothetical protein